MTNPQASIRRVRGQRPGATVGYIVTWDVNSRDRVMCNRVFRFVFGSSVTKDGKEYAYPGFVDRDGVWYLGQSVLFVTQPRLRELDAFLHRHGVSHAITRASIGSRVSC